MVQEAIQRRTSFNLIHFESMTKIDIFLLKSRLFDLQAFERTSSSGLENSPAGRQFQLASPEDTILNKLEWYRQGGEVSERQWTDVLGVLKVQSKSLDRAYLLRWAVQLGVEDLLKRSLEDAGFNASLLEGFFVLLWCLFAGTASQDRYQFLAPKRGLGHGHSDELKSCLTSLDQFLLQRGRFRSSK